MRRLSVLLSMLLAVLFVGCNGCGEDLEDDGISEVMKAWEKKIERARAGLSTDFDGDGFEEYLQWTDKDGVIHGEIKSPDGDFYFLSELRPDETRITFYDSDGDGIFDKRIEEKPDGRVYYISNNSNGVFDERIIVTYDFENNKSLRVFETLKPDGGWEETLSNTAPIYQEFILLPETETAAGVRESLLQGFLGPQYAIGKIDPYNGNEYGGEKGKIGNNLEIKITGAGSCNNAQIEKIKGAFDNIFSGSKALECLSRTNPTIGERLRGLVNNPVHAGIDCGRPEYDSGNKQLNGDAASQNVVCIEQDKKSNCTKSNCSTPGLCKISIKESTFSRADDAMFMSLMLHEYLHLLGYELQPGHNESQGDDPVTACGRYCAGCPDGTSNGSDCENCAKGKDKGSQARVKECDPYDKQWEGIKEVEKTGPCPNFGRALWLCQNGLKCIGTPCETCKWTVYENCGKTKSPQAGKIGRLLCCESCPSSCDSSEGKPFEPIPSCKGKNFNMQNTCGDPEKNKDGTPEDPTKNLPPTVQPFCPGGIKNPKIP